jgi:WD40 repeat protein
METCCFHLARILVLPFGMRIAGRDSELMVCIFVLCCFFVLIDIRIAGHTGAVWDIDPSWDSQYVLTAGADGSARLFECTTGTCLAKMPHKG